MNNEPIFTVAGVIAAVTAVLALLAAFGLPVTPDQTNAILGFVAVVAPLAVAFIARKFTVPTARVESYETKEGELVAGEGSALPTGSPVEPAEAVNALANGL